MFAGEECASALKEMIRARDARGRAAALARMLSPQRETFVGIFREMRGLPITIRLLASPLRELLPPPAMDFYGSGHRGCRLAVAFPEIYAMQGRAIFEATVRVAGEGIPVFPEIALPLVLGRQELERTRAILDAVAGEVFGATRDACYAFGASIQLPRAALLADELAQVAEFFSFGTCDLTREAMGLSTNDERTLVTAYVEAGILRKDPLASLDVPGVGVLVQMAVERGRRSRPALALGACGEHAHDPASIAFFQKAGLDYVSCGPLRIPIARLAAAQAALRAQPH
jgi:pyruvate,orthophosphate dikinase